MTETCFSSSFSNIDAASNPTEFVHYMDDANAMEFFRAAKIRTHELLALRAGDHVLDVGCGAGDDVRTLARIVGPTGRAVGVDSSQTMVDAAQQRSADSPLPVAFCVGDAEQLDFPDASFDGCRTDRVLQHLTTPASAVAEMVRVLRPGGRLVGFEPDTGGLMIDAPDREVTRKITHFRGDIVRSGWIGRQLPRLCKDAGLSEVEVTVLPSPRTDYQHTNASLRLDYYARSAAAAGVISIDEARRWSESLAAAAAADRFFCVVMMFMVTGVKR
ncbi:MAG TPA: methyltransferase domain-containing protein [Chloroflexota bacterium]|nr:methyltransferase domain-containing protein [Chloroflexota bacterium]